MFIKHTRFVLIVILIMMMFLPGMPAAASAPSLPQAEIIAYHPLTGMVRFMGAQSGAPILEATALESKATPEKAALSFLTMRGAEFGLVDAKKDLRVLRETLTDNDTSAVRFQQTYQGIPILAGEMIVHIDSASNVLSASGDILPNIELDTTPLIDESIAIQNALEATAKESGFNIEDLQASVPELWIYNPALLTPYNGETVLTWRVEVTPKTDLVPLRQLVLVDAKRGGIVLSFNQVDFAKNRLTYNAAGTSSIPGTLICNESNPTCSGGSTDAVNAHLYAGQTYDFYMTNHGRDSIDGAGLTLISTIDYDDVPGGASYQNAFWSGAQMVYGAGFASADDVVAHELTHGVTDYESKLFYFWQSGAINESFSDVWGEFIDLTNGMGTDTSGVRWQMGEDLPASVGVIRNMQDPTIYNDPDKITSGLYYAGNADNGGVHTNSGINNKAASLMVDGGTFNGQTITGLGVTKAAKIYYYAQSNLLTSGSDYADLYYALQTSCAAQIGAAGITSADCQEVLDAVNAVEMNLQPSAGYNPDTAACDVAGEYPVNSFYDDLETGSANWVSGAATGSNHWSYDWPYTADLGLFAHSGQHFLYADDYPAEPTDTYLSMITGVTVPPNGKLLFHHAYAIETGFDGGMLEYSSNGGLSWTDAGSLMDGNGYDAALSSSSGNPLGGRQAFTGLSHGYISTRLNLSSLAGQNVKFRFRMGLDSSYYALGWWLDDVQVYECKPATIRFAVIGDFGQAGQPEADVAALVNSWNPDFIITTGDNNYSLGEAATIDSNIGQYYHQYIYPYSGTYGSGAASNNFYPALGNHDWLSTVAQLPGPYLDYFSLPGNERYYEFTRGPVHFFVVDSDSNEPDGITSGSTQGQWLQSALAASTEPWNVVYLHHSPYSSGPHGSNVTLQWPFQTWGADIVLSGHDHTYERLSINGLPYIVNGLGGNQTIYSFTAPVAGSQLRYNADYGAMLVDAANAYVNFKFITRTGTVIDSFTVTKYNLFLPLILR